MPRIHSAPLRRITAIWLAATVTTLIFVDRAVQPLAPIGASGILTEFGQLLGPWTVLPGLAVIATGATLVRALPAPPNMRRRACDLLSAAWPLLKSGALATLAAVVIKTVIGRARPQGAASDWFAFQPFTMQEAWQSLPSAHAALAGALMATALRLWPRRLWLWLVLGLLAAAARVFSGDHWPSDVVAGLGLGVVVGLLATRHTAHHPDGPCAARATRTQAGGEEAGRLDGQIRPRIGTRDLQTIRYLSHADVMHSGELGGCQIGERASGHV